MHELSLILEESCTEVLYGLVRCDRTRNGMFDMGPRRSEGVWWRCGANPPLFFCGSCSVSGGPADTSQPTSLLFAPLLCNDLDQIRLSALNIVIVSVTESPKHTPQSQQVVLRATAKLQKVLAGVLFVFGLTCFTEN